MEVSEQNLAPKLLLNHIVTLVSTLLAERKICFVLKTWSRARVCTEKRESVLM